MSQNPIQSIYLGTEDEPYEGGHLLYNLLLFGRVCKVLGMDVTPNRMIEVGRALEYVHLGRKVDFYFALRGLMVTHRRDFDKFDEAFNLFWRRPTHGQTTLPLRSLGEKRHKRKTQFLPPPESEPEDTSTSDDAKPALDPNLIALVPTFSQQEVLRNKDFAEMSNDELALARQIIERLPKSLGFRKSRRYGAGKGQWLDLRRGLRHSLRYGGEMLSLPTKTRKLKPRPVVMVCDISGSMERYTRILLHFMHTLSSSMYQVQSFVFSTHLTHVTHQIRHKSVDSALHDVGLHVTGWGGGTRTGDALKEFNYYWGRRVLGRGAVVMLITDGWDRGEPQLLGEEMARLQRSCHRLIWLNPLLGAPEYEPLTRGAQAILPYVDDFLPVRNLANLQMLVKVLGNLQWQRSEQQKLVHIKT